MSDYLAQLKSSVGRSQSRRANRKQLVQQLLATMPPPTASGAAPTGGSGVKVTPQGAGGHHPGDGHNHGISAKGMDPEFNSALERFLKDSGGKIKVNSGYRSVERQAQLWQQALKKYGSAAAARKWVAPPGRSNHNHGLAADLGYLSPEARKWAHANAARYGLVFPLSNEPWHIEPRKARKK